MSGPRAYLATLASDGDEVAHHLLMDFLLKTAIVVTAMVIVTTGMVIIWRKVGSKPARKHQEQTDSSSRRETS